MPHDPCRLLVSSGNPGCQGRKQGIPERGTLDTYECTSYIRANGPWWLWHHRGVVSQLGRGAWSRFIAVSNMDRAWERESSVSPSGAGCRETQTGKDRNRGRIAVGPAGPDNYGPDCTLGRRQRPTPTGPTVSLRLNGLIVLVSRLVFFVPAFHSLLMQFTVHALYAGCCLCPSVRFTPPLLPATQ